LVVLVVLFAVSTESAAQTTDTRRPALVVRTFDRYGVSPTDLRAAEEDATVILNAAGVEVSWVNCWEVDKEPAAAAPLCRLPLGRNEVILRIQSVNSRAARTPLVPMGYSLVRCGNGAPNLSTVYADEVASVASRAGVDARALLGRAIAHEIGHLLLDTDRHAKAGLMRAVWSQSELRRNHVADWSFHEEEARMMRAAISSRTASGN
jgi:hypothetical protein